MFLFKYFSCDTTPRTNNNEIKTTEKRPSLLLEELQIPCVTSNNEIKTEQGPFRLLMSELQISEEASTSTQISERLIEDIPPIENISPIEDIARIERTIDGDEDYELTSANLNNTRTREDRDRDIESNEACSSEGSTKTQDNIKHVELIESYRRQYQVFMVCDR